jgi:hypothetical protein
MLQRAIDCGFFEASQSASLSAKGGSNNACTSSGGGGRICVGLGISEADLETLAAGETPAGLTYGPLTVVAASVKGGAASEISTGVRWYAESGTATSVSSATGDVNLRVTGDPLQGGDPTPGYNTHCYPLGETVTCVGYSYSIGAGFGGRGGAYNATYGNTYGKIHAPIQPGSCNGAYQSPLNGGGLIRIHAARVELNGTLNANANLTSWAGGPSGGASG